MVFFLGDFFACVYLDTTNILTSSKALFLHITSFLHLNFKVSVYDDTVKGFSMVRSKLVVIFIMFPRSQAKSETNS